MHSNRLTANSAMYKSQRYQSYVNGEGKEDGNGMKNVERKNIPESSQTDQTRVSSVFNERNNNTNQNVDLFDEDSEDFEEIVGIKHSL